MEHHRKNIAELFEGYTGDYKPKETDWARMSVKKMSMPSHSQ